MNRFQKAYGKSWLTAQDLPRAGIKPTITSMRWEEMRDFSGKDVEKAIAEFDDLKPYIFTAKVAQACAEHWGEDIKSWIGKRLPLYPVRTEIKGESKLVIRADPEGFDFDDDVEMRNDPRSARQQHPGERLYASGKKDNGSVQDLPDNDLDPSWGKEEDK